MSWTEVPGGMVTNLPVTATITPSGELYVFAVGTDQGIYYNCRSGDSWARAWTKIPNGQTKCSVAAIPNGTEGALVVITGMDGKLYASGGTAKDGVWTAWQSLDGGAGSTTMAAAGTRVSTQFAWFLTGNDKHVYVDYTKYAEDI